MRLKILYQFCSECDSDRRSRRRTRGGNALGDVVGGKPVSYTHLDVYKRQPEGCVCVCVCGSAVSLSDVSTTCATEL